MRVSRLNIAPWKQIKSGKGATVTNARCHHGAEKDLEDIFDYIAEDSPRLAGEFVHHLREKALRIGTAPGSYPRRPANGEGIRVAFLSPYVILFHILTDTVEVLHIVHGARDLNRLFESD